MLDVEVFEAVYSISSVLLNDIKLVIMVDCAILELVQDLPNVKLLTKVEVSVSVMIVGWIADENV